jgi:hypothetical protein
MKSLLSLIILTVFSLFFATQAYAYIDPGTGSMLIQALIGAVAAVSVSIGIFWRHIRSFLDRLFGRNKNE